MAQPARSRRRPGLPAKSSVVMEKVLVPRHRAALRGAPSPGIPASYRILRTNEVDPKDTAVPRAAVIPFAARAAPVGEDFAGTARKSAKLAIASAQTETFVDLQGLLKTLPSKKAMKNRKPKITTNANSRRVDDEKRNVRLLVFLYAASREDDNDFHLIIGRDPDSTPHVYMTVEISGLPPKSRASFAALKAARKSFKTFFGADLPGTSYDFYDPPIAVEIEGSLFFDMSHATGQGPGPKSLRKDIPTVWEVHPVSSIVFEP